LSGFEDIPEQLFDRRNPRSTARIHLSARTSFDENGALQFTNLPAKVYSNKGSVARIEDSQLLRVVGPGAATIYSRQERNQVFKPTNDRDTPNSKRDVSVLELCEFDIAAPETRLKAGYPILFTSLQTLLNFGPRQLIWSKDLKKVTVVATYEKASILTRLLEHTLGAHNIIAHFHRLGVESLETEGKSLIDNINRDSPRIPIFSPVTPDPKQFIILKDIKQFLQLLKAECVVAIERFEKEVDAVVEASIY
jgi:hypothetical protein